MRICHLLIAACATLWPQQGALAAPIIETAALANGMEIVVIPNHRVAAVSHMLWYRVGSADDPPGKSGLAHFHEHLMFLGTKAHASGEFTDIIARHGGQQNAFTGADATSYFVNIAKEELPLVMSLEADRMRGLAPLDAEVDKERQVILEERRSRIENNPGALLDEQMDAALFRHHPYRLPVIGWMHEMEGLTKADVLAFHARHYHPNNAMLIVSGDITMAELKPLAERYYGGIPKADIPPRRWNDEPPQIAPRRVALRHANVKQPVWLRSYAAPSMAYGDKAQAMPLFVLSYLLGGGKTSRLYQSLVVEQKLASSVDSSYNGFSLGPAQLEIRIVPEPGVSMETIEAAVDAQMARLTADGPDEAELARAKTLLKAESIFAREGLDSMARIMGWLRIAGLPADYFNLWAELIGRISQTEIKAAAGALDMRASVTGLLLPPAAEAAP